MSRLSDGRELVINAPHATRCTSCGAVGNGPGPCTCLITGNGKRSPKNMSDSELRASMLDHQAEMARREGDDHEDEDDVLDPQQSERNDGTDDHGFDGMRPQDVGRGKRAGSPPDRDDWQPPQFGDPVSEEEMADMEATQAAKLGLTDFGTEVHQGRTNYSVPNDYSRGQRTKQPGTPGFSYTTNEDGEDILGQLPITEILANERRQEMKQDQARKQRRRRPNLFGVATNEER